MITTKPVKLISEFVPLTRELALEFAQMRPLPGERPLKDARLKFFRNCINNGSFNSPTWSKVYVGDDKTPYRTDGQHTSHILAKCDEAMFPHGLQVTVDSWQVASEAELGDLFDLFNNPISTRSNTDKMGVFVAKYEDLGNIERKFLARTAHGLNYYYKTLSASTDTPRPPEFSTRDYGMYFEDETHRRFAVWLYRYNNVHPHGWMLGKPGIVAEMFTDWRAFPTAAESFWNYVIRESHPDNEDETRELARTFREWSRKKPTVKQDKYMAKANKTWERFRRSLILQQREAAQGDQPVAA